MAAEPVVITCMQLETPLQESKNWRIDRAMQMIEHAPTSDLIVLPELWPTGYFAFDQYEAEAETVGGQLTARLRDEAVKRRCFIIGGSFVERREGGLANCAIGIDRTGEIVLEYRKIHLFGNSSQESALLMPGSELAITESRFGRIAITTCYDLRFPELYRALMDAGAQMVVVVAAWPAARRAHWRLLTQARAVENQFFVVACNGAGVQRDIPLAGASQIVDPWGEVVSIAGCAEQMLTATIDMSKVEEVRQEFPVLADRRKDIYTQTPTGENTSPDSIAWSKDGAV